MMISIIVPVLNEEKTIERTLRMLSNLNRDKEIIVVDGGSSDNTVKVASSYAKTFESPRGRALQMNLGAQKSTGEILWFVHSDSILEEDSLIRIQEAIEEGYVGGGFSLYFYDLDTKFMKFVSWSSNLRGKYLGLYFGDQGIFVRKDIFNKIGGYPEIPIMEDWELSLRLKKIGLMKMLNTRIGTSARRFKSGGAFKTLMLMHKIKILYSLGVSPDILAKMYREAR
jgi:rSAM/selenodomain-associated transferase 2